MVDEETTNQVAFQSVSQCKYNITEYCNTAQERCSTNTHFFAKVNSQRCGFNLHHCRALFSPSLTASMGIVMIGITQEAYSMNILRGTSRYFLSHSEIQTVCIPMRNS